MATKDRPGIVRLRATNAGPRFAAARQVVRQIVAVPLPLPRRPKRPVPEQAALFD